MNESRENAGSESTAITLVVRRTIRAGAARLFECWTDPVHLAAWWGPASVTCTHAETDLRVGGRYRLANRFPDGGTLWIVGEFQEIAPPHRLVYTWRVEPGPDVTERVTVRFEPRRDATEVIITHERIADADTRERHEQGWLGCLDGLTAYVAAHTRQPPKPG